LCLVFFFLRGFALPEEVKNSGADGALGDGKSENENFLFGGKGATHNILIQQYFPGQM
jgi:hypothetical protein